MAVQEKVVSEKNAFLNWIKKVCVDYTAKGHITILHSQLHRCPDTWIISIVHAIVQASMIENASIGYLGKTKYGH